MKTFANMKILVVDDSRTDREMIKDILIDAGFKSVRTAGSAKETFSILGISDSGEPVTPVDLILMDIVMPKIDGIEACKVIKSVESLNDLPTIMVTARPNDENLQHAFDKGAIDYIKKPLNKVELLSRVRHALMFKEETDRRKDHEQKLMKMAENLRRTNKVKNELLKDLRDAVEEIKLQNSKLENEIGDRKRAEDSLRFFEKAVENMQIGVTISDLRGNILYVNPAEAQIHGYEKDELRWRSIRVFSPPERWKPMTIEQIMKFKSRRRESINLKKDGSTFPVQLLSDIVTNTEGKVTGVVTTCEDITERKRSEEILKKTQEELEKRVRERTKELTVANALLKEEVTEKLSLQAETVRAAHLASLGELSAGVAHEINNPINGIINCAQILVNRCSGQQKEKDICEMIISEGKRVANIVQALLSFAREREGEKKPVHISNIMADSLALTSAHLRRNGIKLTVEIPDDLPVVVAHYQQIQQVFLNLINNAQYALNHKYPKGSKDKSLKITSEMVSVNQREFVRLAFLDNGTGIPSDILDKVMNPFFSTKPEDKGTGLGLSISHGIIADHGGRLSIESKEGKFTKVMIDLPVGKQ